MASGIVSDLSWCQKLQQQKCAKLSAVIRSKLFLHEYESTHEAEQALPAWRGTGRSSRARGRCCPAAAVPVAFANHTKQQQHAKPVGLVLPRACCSRIRAETASI